MKSSANMLDLSPLPPALRRELRDFYQFLLQRGIQEKKKRPSAKKNYDFSDISGTLTWKGDAVAAQRRLRDEW